MGERAGCASSLPRRAREQVFSPAVRSPGESPFAVRSQAARSRYFLTTGMPAFSRPPDALPPGSVAFLLPAGYRTRRAPAPRVSAPRHDSDRAAAGIFSLARTVRLYSPVFYANL